jgi:hypothetical protein
LFSSADGVGLPELAEMTGALKGQGRKHDLEEGGVANLGSVQDRNRRNKNLRMERQKVKVRGKR